MTYRVLRAADHRRMPWKNGRGETIEVMVHPQGAGLEDFGWRVSMAGVTEDGNFSVFPGIDRSLAVLSGAGISLSLGAQAGQGQVVQRLTPTTPPLAFAADRPATAYLLDGPITDLNVMTRRGVYRHRLVAQDVGQDPPRDAPDWVLLLATAGPATCRMGDGALSLSRFDAVLCTGAGAAAQLAAPAIPGLWRIEIFREAIT